jgi:mannose-1-phosphate guanylyltransferase/mannose-6-phosphate isomerase
MKVVILAGGSGTRLWPLSREKSPKQVVAPFGNSSLLKQTIERVKKLVKPRDIFVVCGDEEKKKVMGEVGSVPPGNILTEPVRRGTAAAIALAAQKISATTPDEPMVVLSSDAYIANTTAYTKALQSGARAIIENPMHLVLIGVSPTYYETGYDYIATGEHVWTDTATHEKFFAVDKFIPRTEKEIIEPMLQKGLLAWNAGIFIARAQHFTMLIERHLPTTAKIFKKSLTDIRRAYPKIPEMSIDKGVLAQESRLLVLPAKFDWIDVGNWQAVSQVMASRKKHEGEDYLASNATNTHVVRTNSANKKKIIALVDVHDLVIVESDDVLLVTSKKNSHNVRDILAMLKKNKKYASYL